MKFIFDAHLPPSLCKIVEDRGHEALTTKDLPFGNSSTDEQITAFSAQEDWVVVTKDKDFYFSHILNRNPLCSSTQSSRGISAGRQNIFPHRWPAFPGIIWSPARPSAPFLSAAVRS